MATGMAAAATVVAMLLAGGGRSDAGATAARPDAVFFPRLSAISCRSASLCIAVGEFGPTHSRTHPYSEIWNGTGWRLLSTPGPAHAHQLSGVSCASRTSCVAIGGASFFGTFADAWNGSRWRVLPTPLQQVGLSGISCPIPGRCMAVGNTNGNAAAERWDGTAWHVLSVPATPGALSSGLASVSCASTANCVAVGSYVSSSAGNPRVPLAEAWNGMAWTMLAAPAVDPAGSLLSSVSCGSAVSCVAVGYTIPPGAPEVLVAEGWDGHSWTVLPAAAPGSANSFLSGVSCASSTSCMAVGGSHGVTGMPGDLAERWNGSTWKITKTPASFAASSVSCPAAASCMAAGGTLAEQWNGSTWQTLRTLRFDSFASVSCPRPDMCMTVGGYVNAAARERPLLEQWNGRAWSVTLPRTRAKFHALSDVSCVSAAICVAVGANRAGIAFAEEWKGHRWRPIYSPELSPTAVSCSSTTRCIATGGQNAAKFDGLTWRPFQVPAPKAFSWSLNDVSCPTTNRCIAVGSKSAIGRADHVVAEELSGGRWRIVPTHLLPPGDLNAVDCTGPSSCMAVGSGLDARWNGRTWRALKTPSPVGMADVSCVSASDCLAVGSYTPAINGNPLQVAEHWNGRRWTLVRTAACCPPFLACAACAASRSVSMAA